MHLKTRNQGLITQHFDGSNFELRFVDTKHDDKECKDERKMTFYKTQ